jgi:universal stress protein A
VFKKIVVPMDLSDKHERAVEIATDLASREEGEVTLLHVIEVIAGLSFEEERAFYSRLEATAREHLDRYGEELAGRGVSWQPEVRYGDRAQEIVRHADETGADLIVLRSHRFDAEATGTGWGVLSYKVGILSTCPVLLVK